jgi:hypothetical protein
MLALTTQNVHPSGSIAGMQLAQTALLEKFKMQSVGAWTALMGLFVAP